MKHHVHMEMRLCSDGKIRPQRRKPTVSEMTEHFWSMVADCISKRRHRTKLTFEQVAELRAYYRKGVLGFGTISTAKKFGIARGTAVKILKGKAWKHTL